MTGRVLALCAGGTGFVKEARTSLDVDALGAHGDRHYGRSADRALLLVPEATYDAIRREGIDVPHGSLGENLVVSGLPADDLAAGTVLEIGEVTAEVTDGCTVCASLAQVDPRLPKLSYRRRGVYLRLAHPGRLHVGDAVRIVSQPDLAGPTREARNVPATDPTRPLAEETA